MTLRGARIVGFGKGVSEFSFNDGTAKSGIGLDVGNDATHGPGQITGVNIEGFGMGMATPVNGTWQVTNVTLQDNGTDLLVQPIESESTTVNLQSVVFDSFEAIDEPGDTLPEHIVIE